MHVDIDRTMRLEAVMKLLRLLLATSVLVAMSHSSLAQSNSGGLQPGPEHERLEFLIGSWNIEYVDKPSPAGAGGKVTGTTTCEWFEGRFQVICRSDLRTAGGSVKQLEVFSYSAGEGGYYRYFIGSGGQAAVSKGMVSGKTWNWGPFEVKDDGKVMRISATVTELSPDSWTSKINLAIDGSAPTMVSEVRAIRIK